MSDSIKEKDLSKVTGGNKEEKLYSFYDLQFFRAKKDKYESISIRGTYINVPGNTEIYCVYEDVSRNKISSEKLTARFIDEFYYECKPGPVER